MALTQLNRKQKYVEFTECPLMHTTFFFSLVSRVKKTVPIASHPEMVHCEKQKFDLTML